MDFEQCFKDSQTLLMEGALGERLKREYGLPIDGPVAMADLIYHHSGKSALRKLWTEYLSIAEEYHLPFLATTPTRRANQSQVHSAGYHSILLYDNVALLKEIQRTANTPMFVGGLMGCKGDAYTGKDSLTSAEAHNFHAWQANTFAKAGADFLFAGIMPVLEEAKGMAMAMSDTGLPYIISFTIRQDGRLIDGTTIDSAIRCIDRHVNHRPLCYMTNCVHPDILSLALSHDFNRTVNVRSRFLGLQANASPLSYEELDGSQDLKCSDPISLAQSMYHVKRKFNLRILGGCCGTDGNYLREIAKTLTSSTKTM